MKVELQNLIEDFFKIDAIMWIVDYVSNFPYIMHVLDFWDVYSCLHCCLPFIRVVIIVKDLYLIYRVFIKICVFSKISKYIQNSGLSRFPLGVSVCTQWQVKHQRCSRTFIVKKNPNILRKNTIFNEHPVCAYVVS